MQGYLSTLTVLTVSAVLILLVACANVAGLLLARGNARRAEMALRSVMGAGGGRLVRQLLTENALLAGAAGLLGVLLGLWVQRGILAFLSLDTLGDLRAGLSMEVVGAALALSVATALISGLLPSVRAARVDPAADLRGVGRTSAGRSATAFRGGLVVTQIALTSLLLALSGLLLRSFVEIRRVDLGFDARSLITAGAQVPFTTTDAERAAFFAELKARIEPVPGVTSVAMSSHLPVRDPGNITGIQLTEAEPDGSLRNGSVAQRAVLPGYFAAMGIPLLAGRAIDASDRADADPVIVLSQSTARRLFGDGDAVGRVVDANANGIWGPRTVVGVVGDVVLGDPTQGPEMAMYLPHAQLARPGMRMAIRARGDAAAVIAVFAATALVLAAVGLYGVLAYRVSLRLREIGIRMALGASAGEVTASVVRRGLTLVATGFLLGCVAALGARRLVEGMLFGVSGNDPLTFAAIAVVLAAVGSLACALPARRAARVSPTEVMRAE